MSSEENILQLSAPVSAGTLAYAEPFPQAFDTSSRTLRSLGCSLCSSGRCDIVWERDGSEDVRVGVCRIRDCRVLRDPDGGSTRSSCSACTSRVVIVGVSSVTKIGDPLLFTSSGSRRVGWFRIQVSKPVTDSGEGALDSLLLALLGAGFDVDRFDAVGLGALGLVCFASCGRFGFSVDALVALPVLLGSDLSISTEESEPEDEEELVDDPDDSFELSGTSGRFTVGSGTLGGGIGVAFLLLEPTGRPISLPKAWGSILRVEKWWCSKDCVVV